nr:hypothetical protein CFP56_00422 [Quercus suber]
MSPVIAAGLALQALDDRQSPWLPTRILAGYTSISAASSSLAIGLPDARRLNIQEMILPRALLSLPAYNKQKTLEAHFGDYSDGCFTFAWAALPFGDSNGDGNVHPMPSHATTLLMWQRAASYPCCKLKETSYASLARICPCVLLSTVPPPLCRGHPRSGWPCNLAVTAAHDHQPTYSLLREAILYGSNSAAWVISTQLQRCPNQPSGRCDTRVFLSPRDPTFGETFSYEPTNRRARMHVVPRRLATTSHPRDYSDGCFTFAWAALPFGDSNGDGNVHPMPSHATTLLMWQRAASYPCCKLKETSYASLARICPCVLLSTVPPPLCRGHPRSGWPCNLAVTAAHDHQPTYSLLREAILYGSNSAAWVISTQLQRCPNQPSGRCDTRVFLSPRDPTFGETFSYEPTNRRARMHVVPRRLATTSHPKLRNDCESTRGDEGLPWVHEVASASRSSSGRLYARHACCNSGRTAWRLVIFHTMTFFTARIKLDDEACVD